MVACALCSRTSGGEEEAWGAAWVAGQAPAWRWAADTAAQSVPTHSPCRNAGPVVRGAIRSFLDLWPTPSAVLEAPQEE